MTLLEHLIRDKMYSHPLPWTIDYDWLVEVYDATGRMVLKLQSDSAARELIGMASRLAVEDAAFEQETERTFHEPEV